MIQTIQPEQCVADAPILLDLSEACLLPALLDSNVSIVTTALVVSNLDETCRQEVNTQLDQGKILIETATEADMIALITEVGPLNQLSGSDRLLFRIAKKMKMSILTGCDCLSQNAERRGIRTRSFLWVLDRLVNNGMLNPKTAAQKLRELQSNSPWLNNKICQQHINQWQSMSSLKTMFIVE